MINNSPNINKTNNHLSSYLLAHTKNLRHMTLEIHVMVWDRHKTVAGLNQLAGSVT
jgi:hypothetical protein